MASGSRDISSAALGMSDDEVAGKTDDGKKKRFKPLEKMRKFFKGGKKKGKEDDGIVTGSIKARSTSAIYKETTQSEDEDDGGFKSVPMVGHRSISEDSVFNPEQRDTTVIGKPVASSVENIKQSFQSELFTKVKTRKKSSPTEAEMDDSYPNRRHTMSDILSVNYQIGAEKESTKPGVDKSRPYGSSDDLFGTSSWKEGKISMNQSDPSMDVDFNAIVVDSPALENDAAKFKISVKPKARKASKRAANRQAVSAATLPDVKEESPPKELQATTTEVSEPKKLEPKAEESKAQTLPEVSFKAPVPNVKASEVDDSQQKSQISLDSNKTSMQISGEIPKKEEDSETEVSILRRKTIQEDKRATQVLPVSPDSLSDVKLRRPKSMMVSSPASQEGKENNELAKAFKRLSVRRENSGERHASDITAGVLNRPTELKPDLNPIPKTIGNSSKEVKTEASLTPDSHAPIIEVGPLLKEPSAEKVLDDKKSPKLSPKSPSASGNPQVFSYSLKKEPLRKASESDDGFPKSVVKSPVSVQDSGTKESNSAIQTHSVSNAENTVAASAAADANKLEQRGTRPEQTVTVTVRTVEDKQSSRITVTSEDKKSPISEVSTNGDSKKLASPKIEYKLKRAARSKTLPEQPVTRDVLEKKLSNSYNPSTLGGRTPIGKTVESSKPENIDNIALVDNVTPASKRIEPKRLSIKDISSGSTEPTWFALARKKQSKNEQKHGEKASTESSANLEIKSFDNVKNQEITTNQSISASSDEKKDRSVGSTVESSKADLPKPSGRVHSFKTSRDSWNSRNKTEILKSQDVVKATTTLTTKEEKDKNNDIKKTPESSENKSLSSRTKLFENKPWDNKSFASSLGKPTPYSGGTKSFSAVPSGVREPVSSSSNVTTTKPSVTADTVNKPSLGSQKSQQAMPSRPSDEKKAPVPSSKVSSLPSSTSGTASTATTQNIPPWKQNLMKKKSDNFNIEIIEKSAPENKPPLPHKPTSKVEEKVAVQLRNKTGKEDLSSNRPSRVLDMVKNFQKLEVS